MYIDLFYIPNTYRLTDLRPLLRWFPAGRHRWPAPWWSLEPVRSGPDSLGDSSGLPQCWSHSWLTRGGRCGRLPLPRSSTSESESSERSWEPEEPTEWPEEWEEQTYTWLKVGRHHLLKKKKKITLRIFQQILWSELRYDEHLNSLLLNY